MTIPSFVLGFLLATLYGALFHLWRGGGPGKLMLFIVLGWIGFWGGHVIANIFSISISAYGPLKVGMATIGSIIVMLLGYWLSKFEEMS